jgi:heparan-alpha-glucosaminide N-acetyltransferase
MRAVAAQRPQRVRAIDAFRGLTILVMIFVNTLAGVRGMPAWLDHAPAGVDGMTFPDVVFPAFLFIVGMSIPFAFAQRRAAGDDDWQLGRHVLVRSFGMLVLGVFMVNAEEGYNEQAMGMSIHVWSLLFYGCALLVWAAYRRRSDGSVPPAAGALRFAGVAGLLYLAWRFRGGADGSLHLAPQWWGILGLIGWAYLYASVLFWLSAGRLVPLLLATTGCIAWYCAAHFISAPGTPLAQLLAGQAENAVHTSIALCGLLTARLFFDSPSPPRFSHALLFAVVFAAVLAMAAMLLRPFFKISKIDATPSWALYSAAICVLLFAALYWLIDLRKVSAWTALLAPAATNPLLTYIIPYIVYAAMQALHLSLPEALGHGAAGLLWAVAYSFAVVALAALLGRMHIKLQL